MLSIGVKNIGEKSHENRDSCAHIRLKCCTLSCIQAISKRFRYIKLYNKSKKINTSIIVDRSSRLLSVFSQLTILINYLNIFSCIFNIFSCTMVTLKQIILKIAVMLSFFSVTFFILIEYRTSLIMVESNLSFRERVYG